ncbi:MAG: uroporphyrinogen-III synthase [Myxococcales bacterium]|nr:MAG: uroporphyrinogen-III synthase [Myxococcales bacterium]
MGSAAMSHSVSPPPSEPAGPLSGLRVVCFESRRSAESSRMIARQGGVPIEAPTLREVPLRGPSGIDELERELQEGVPVLLVLLTGVGTELLIEGLAQGSSRERALAFLGAPTTTLVCRGPKPHAALKPVGLKPAVIVGEPNTWRDVLREIDDRQLLAQNSVYVQEYGRTNAELVKGLAERGARSVRQIKTYAWQLPDDLAPLHAAIERIAEDDAEVALFTSGIQLTHLLQVAEERGRTQQLYRGLERMVIASVGPLTSEALSAAGLRPDIEPDHPKLGHLMVALAELAPSKLAEKRGSERRS